MADAAYRVGITGATGYVGRALIRSLPTHWSAVLLTRRGMPPHAAHRHADLRQPVPEGLLDGLDAVVHLAADTGTGGVAASQELRFALELATQAWTRRIPLLFLSSQAADREAPTGYGRVKAAIEEAILPLDAIVIRPGLVYGGEEQGLFGLLCGVLRRFRIAPKLLPPPQVQPVHVDDLARAITGALADPANRGTVFPVAGTPMPFNSFLGMIARYRVRRFVLPLPVPVWLLRLVLRVGGRLFGPRLGPERLDSLVRLGAMDASASMARLGVVPRDVRDGLSPGGGPQRRLLLEARALASSLVPTSSVPRAFLRRYLAALRALGQHDALELPDLALRHPAVLASLDRPQHRKDAGLAGLAGRMDLAYRLCESEPTLAPRFVRDANNAGRTRALLDVASAAARELQALALLPVARLLVRGRR